MKLQLEGGAVVVGVVERPELWLFVAGRAPDVTATERVTVGKTSLGQEGSQEPVACILIQLNPIHTLHPASVRSILILSSRLCLCLTLVSSTYAFEPQFLVTRYPKLPPSLKYLSEGNVITSRCVVCLPYTLYL
jgi:hypothetical protein